MPSSGWMHRLSRLHWKVASAGIGGKAGGRCHGHQGQDLKQVVLKHVAQDAGLVVVVATRPDRYRFGDRNLHVLDKVMIPDRLKKRVGESKYEDILDRLLAEV